jgi:hypothetical protein
MGVYPRMPRRLFMVEGEVLEQNHPLRRQETNAEARIHRVHASIRMFDREALILPA